MRAGGIEFSCSALEKKKGRSSALEKKGRTAPHWLDRLLGRKLARGWDWNRVLVPMRYKKGMSRSGASG